jgi:anti-anti-sigma factor
MPLNLAVSTHQGVPVHAVKGRVDSATAGELEKALQPLYATPGERVVLDFGALDYISSAGLRVVLMLAKRAKSSQGRLLLCSLSPQVREVFEISGFLKILEVSADPAAALAALG